MSAPQPDGSNAPPQKSRPRAVFDWLFLSDPEDAPLATPQGARKVRRQALLMTLAATALLTSVLTALPITRWTDWVQLVSGSSLAVYAIVCWLNYWKRLQRMRHEASY